MTTKEPRRRTKPCMNCKRNKVRCQYIETLPCVRCQKHNLRCFYPENEQQNPEENIQQQLTHVSENTQTNWETTVDYRLNTFENALESVLSSLQSNQAQQQHQINLLQQQLQQQQGQQQPSHYSINQRVKLPSVRELESFLYNHPSTSQRNYSESLDFRETLLINKEEAKELLELFSTKLAPHLFGYDIGKLSVDALWEESPILLASICTVSCTHHSQLQPKFYPLRRSLESFASRLLLHQNEKMEIEHTILALIIAALWLDSGQMFISIAIQLARLNRIDECGLPETDNRKRQRLRKLWYLLYIIDGNQNLILDKSPSIYKKTEPTIIHSRENLIENLANNLLKSVLLDNNNGKMAIVSNRQLELLNEVGHDKIEISGSAFQDLRLLGQLEYHMAMESVFHNKPSAANTNFSSLNSSMSLIDPSRLGIPWQNNVDLDKWMISWTIALQNVNVQNDAWCLKSTLLYYNFARMHINTKPLIKESGYSLLGNLTSAELLKLWHPYNQRDIEYSNSHRELDASKEISRSAAISLLKLATKDKDIKKIFQFLPIHVYVMLYQASLVLLSPSGICSDGLEQNVEQIGDTLKLVTKFKEMISSEATSDREFKKKLLSNLDLLLLTFKNDFINKSHQHQAELPTKLEEILDNTQGDVPIPENESKKGKRNKPILAWPGTNHGHP